jgi:hypothetical protein
MFFADDGISVGLADGGEDMDMKDWNATIIGPTRVCSHLSYASTPSNIQQMPNVRMRNLTKFAECSREQNLLAENPLS